MRPPADPIPAVPTQLESARLEHLLLILEALLQLLELLARLVVRQLLLVQVLQLLEDLLLLLRAELDLQRFVRGEQVELFGQRGQLRLGGISPAAPAGEATAAGEAPPPG